MGPRRRSPFLLAVLLAATTGLSCGGPREPGREESGPAGPSTAGVAALGTPDDPSPAATPPPTWIPPGTFACPLGKGERHATCAPGSAPAFAAEVDAAVERVVHERPDLFEGGDPAERVLDEEPFHLAVATLLQGRGLCAGWDLIDLQVRAGSGFSEQYDLFDRKGRLQQGAERFRATCTPASFPLDATERIDSLRVAFYGITCADGRTPPRNAEARIPLGCTGFVTATPKDARGDDVDARFHGPYITWQVEQRYDFVRVVDYPGVPFNKVLRAESRGDFRLCATVQGHKGCLEARVTAN